MMIGTTQTSRGNATKKEALTKEARRHDNTASSSSTKKKAVAVSSFGLLAVLIAAMPSHVGARIYNKNSNLLASRVFEPTIKRQEQADNGFLRERTSSDQIEEGSNNNSNNEVKNDSINAASTEKKRRYVRHLEGTGLSNKGTTTTAATTGATDGAILKKMEEEDIADSKVAAYFNDPISDVRVVDYNLNKTIASDIVTYSDNITAPLTGNTTEAISMSLDFSGTIIQDGDVIKVTSITDGASQELTTTILEAYDFTTVYFNGMDVEVEYTRGDGTSGENRRVVVTSLVVDYGTIDEDNDDDEVGESICFGVDDRTPSNDPRVGRFNGGCSAWLISDDVFVTAGHCVGCREGQIRDGICNAFEAKPPPTNGYVVEFEVPLSTSDGQKVTSAPEDQYRVRFDSGGLRPERGTEWFDDSGIGNDWVVGRLLPNARTRKTAGDAQGCWFNLEFGELSPLHPIRVTGHTGPPVNRPELRAVQQTHLGPLRQPAAGENFRLRYQTDTTGGDSGAPIINDRTGWSIGVHTNAGCNEDGGSNNGMSNEQPLFKAAISRYLGVIPEEQVRSPICPTDFPGKPPLPPSSSPTSRPTTSPSSQPTSKPSSQPSSSPTSSSTSSPTSRPTSPPSSQPTSEPSSQQSSSPTSSPTTSPSSQLTSEPSSKLSSSPTFTGQTSSPTSIPTLSPSSQLTSEPSSKLSSSPTFTGKNFPPTSIPSLSPSSQPTSDPLSQRSSQSKSGKVGKVGKATKSSKSTRSRSSKSAKIQ